MVISLHSNRSLNALPLVMMTIPVSQQTVDASYVGRAGYELLSRC
jgi:hypothetical protein